MSEEKFKCVHSLPGLPSPKGLSPIPSHLASERQELTYLRDGSQGSHLRAVCCAVLWVFTHFPRGAAVLGISGHIVFAPNEMQQVLSGSFACLSHAHHWSLWSSHSLSLCVLCWMWLSHPKCRPILDLGFPQHSYTLLPRDENYSVFLHTTPRPWGSGCRHRSIYRGTSTVSELLFEWHRVALAPAEHGVEVEDQPRSSRFYLNLSGVPDVLSILPFWVSPSEWGSWRVPSRGSKHQVGLVSTPLVIPLSLAFPTGRTLPFLPQ